MLSKIYLLLVLLLGLTSFQTFCQQNLIRNFSFENGTGSPSGLNQMHKCNFWRTYETLGAGGPATSDWFKGTPNGFQGTVSCGLSFEGTFNRWPVVPLDDGNHYVGMVKWQHELEGEGVEQKLQQKLHSGYYQVSFDYLVPCDTMTYELQLYLGSGINSCDFLAATLPLSTATIGQWQHVVRQVMIPDSLDNQLDWFIVLNTSPYGYTGAGSYSPYIYVDKFHFHKKPCQSCDPNGLISWNQQSPRPYMTPDGDHVFDQWCVTNVNNISSYE